MRVVFLGTPQFAVPCLAQLSEAGYEIPGVFTQPDRPQGRGQQVGIPPVKQKALELGLPVYQPERIRRPEAIELLRGLQPEALAVVGYGQILPQAVIDIAPLGAINVHASLLPKYRGAAPIQWAIANGELETGVTTMKIDAGLDTGDMLERWSTAIGPDETAEELSERLAQAGARLLHSTLSGLRLGSIHAVAQNHSEATLAPLLKKEDGQIDWTMPAAVIHNRVRGLRPWPGCYTTFRGQLFRIWRTKPDTLEPLEGPPGTLIAQRRRLLVVCGEGSGLELLETQLEGKKKVSGEAFLNGQRLIYGERLGESKN